MQETSGYPHTAAEIPTFRLESVPMETKFILYR